MHVTSTIVSLIELFAQENLVGVRCEAAMVVLQLSKFEDRGTV